MTSYSSSTIPCGQIKIRWNRWLIVISVWSRLIVCFCVWVCVLVRSIQLPVQESKIPSRLPHRGTIEIIHDFSFGVVGVVRPNSKWHRPVRGQLYIAMGVVSNGWKWFNVLTVKPITTRCCIIRTHWLLTYGSFRLVYHQSRVNLSLALYRLYWRMNQLRNQTEAGAWYSSIDNLLLYLSNNNFQDTQCDEPLPVVWRHQFHQTHRVPHISELHMSATVVRVAHLSWDSERYHYNH